MKDLHKKQFWLMINIAMELTNHPPLSKEAIITWWHLLSSFEYEVVEGALNGWVNSTNRPPTPHDIKDLCQKNIQREVEHKITITARIPSPLAIAENKRRAEEVVEFVSQNTKKKKDYKKWARDILDNPKSTDFQINFAKEALSKSSYGLDE